MMADMTTGESNEWLDDESVSFDDAMAHFESLDPQPTVGPELPASGVYVVPAATYGGVTIDATPAFAHEGVVPVSA
jgi:hypothetical protein